MNETRHMAEDSQYAIASSEVPRIAAPDLPYRPPHPETWRPRIGLVGAGGIAHAHLEAYRDHGFDVAVIMDRHADRAEARRDEYFPDAEATDDLAAVLGREDIDIVDITTHPKARVELIEQALEAGKHVLSQKPFVTDLDIGERLCRLAEDKELVLAVNQNGRWAPYFAYMREAVRRGLIGTLQSVHLGVHWDHSWTKGTRFEEIDDLVFYDFAIHWFDFLGSLIGETATSVYATRARAAGQEMAPPMLAQALVAFPGGQASLVFDAHAVHGALHTSFISGTEGALISTGPDLADQVVEIHTAEGVGVPALGGRWFNDGFAGAMGELAAAIEAGRTPINGARENLSSLALCFAAIASSHGGGAVSPGSVRRISD
ncbi:Gfo/Idh/MocA family oxidoreductase [Arsenicitalea aurantiaca]|uniref:Gfo/Idh/MocA family oxidoreductase n=1 Tax=Arsenicitalea aurantiaca TaxID=1783274 RepID=A0A433X859_9HYPH|nr:Gfo/Idh/MocA family oxidoreductase [Arsenicitalea aurantiaca]RUT30228.1 Gfo/Idh/MocA family oxidoreductase [Arsenicitalea aurantiaca]